MVTPARDNADLTRRRARRTIQSDSGEPIGRSTAALISFRNSLGLETQGSGCYDDVPGEIDFLRSNLVELLICGRRSIEMYGD